MDINKLSSKIIGTAIEVHKTLGPGLLKNESPELLGESIEKLSLYLIQNKFIITRAKQLRHEQLELFCAD